MAWCWSITSSSTPRSRRSSLAWPTNYTSSTRRSFSSSRYRSVLYPLFCSFSYLFIFSDILLFIPKCILLLQSDKGTQHTLTSAVFVWLAEYIDGFSLMTYDYSTSLRYHAPFTTNIYYSFISLLILILLIYQTGSHRAAVVGDAERVATFASRPSHQR
jgi:hypothetical protein